MHWAQMRRVRLRLQVVAIRLRGQTSDPEHALLVAGEHQVAIGHPAHEIADLAGLGRNRFALVRSVEALVECLLEPLQGLGPLIHPAEIAELRPTDRDLTAVTHRGPEVVAAAESRANSPHWAGSASAVEGVQYTRQVMQRPVELAGNRHEWRCDDISAGLFRRYL